MAHGRGRGPGAWLVATLLTACGGGSGGTESPADAETPAPDAARPEIDAEGDVPDSAVRGRRPDARRPRRDRRRADAARRRRPRPTPPAPDAALGPGGPALPPCTAEGACEAAGSICLTNQATGEQFCGVDCSGMGECPRGSQCFDLGEGNMQCAPTQATCAGWPPSDLGAPCDVDATCRRGADQCVLGFCTLGCASDAECPNGFRTCLAGVCQPDWMGGPEGCGLGATACAADDGSVCWQGDADHPLPATVRPFDTMPCDDDAQCNAGARCGLIGGARRCVPAPCACLDESTRGPLDDALALTGLTRCDAIFTRESMDLFPENLRADGWRLPFYDRIHRESPRALDFGRALTTQWAAAESEGGAAGVLIERLARPCSARRSPRPRPGADDTDLLEVGPGHLGGGGRSRPLPPRGRHQRLLRRARRGPAAALRRCSPPPPAWPWPGTRCSPPPASTPRRPRTSSSACPAPWWRCPGA